MEHVVFFPGADGKPAFARFGAMDEAVAFVERLRNVEGVGEASLYVLTPVPMVVRAYYRVEVPPPGFPGEPIGEGPAAEVPFVAPPVAEVAPMPAPAAVPAQPAAETTPAEVTGQEPAEVPAGVGTPDIIAPAANGRRSLGFFTH